MSPLRRMLQVGGAALGVVLLVAVASRMIGSARSEPEEAAAAGSARPDGPSLSIGLGHPGQGVARANPLHAAHIDSAEIESCDDCHKFVTMQPGFRELAERCRGCHPEHEPAVHAASKNHLTHECLTCHDFMNLRAASPGPWDCARCHVAGRDSASMFQIADAPKIEAHGTQECKNCHGSHGGAATEPRDCLECHENMTSGHQAGKEGPGACLGCHNAHSTAAGAGASCTTECHQAEKGASWGALKHESCRNCHRQHAPEQVASGQCESCHEAVRIDHAGGDKDACLGCHQPHSRNVATACSSCHKEAKHDRAFHGGSATCSSCHRPHSFASAKSDVSFCTDCHAKQRGSAHVVPANNAEHRNCLACHKGSAHAPTKPKPNCASCHEEQERTLTMGHYECRLCHDTHSGRIESQTGCGKCHRGSTKGAHARMKAGCGACHPQHKASKTIPACESCHPTSRLPGLHRSSKHQKCGDCHQAHDAQIRINRAGCVECHDDQSGHEPGARSCYGAACHPFGRGR